MLSVCHFILFIATLAQSTYFYLTTARVQSSGSSNDIIIPEYMYEEIDPDTIMTLDVTRSTAVEVHLSETIPDNEEFGASSQNPAYGL